MKKATTKTNVKENTVKKTTTAKVETSSKTTAAKSTAPTKTAGAKTKGMLTTLKSLLDSGKITDKKLKAEVQNSLKVKNPTAESVSELLKRVIDSGKQPVVANETKPTAKKTVTKKTEDKKTAKPAPKKEEEPKVVPLKTTGESLAPLALMFPETIVTDIEGTKTTLEKVADTEYTSIKDIVEAVENDVPIFIAAYWSKRQLKEYKYGAFFALPEKLVPKEFPNDLDILQGITVSKRTEKLWAMSSYTDAMYVFSEEDFEPIEDKNPYNGEKYKVRVSNGMEFAVYRIKKESKVKSTTVKTRTK